MIKISLEHYSCISKNYEKSLNAGFKKDNGIFYTDIKLASQIMEFLSLPKKIHNSGSLLWNGKFSYSGKRIRV